MNYREAHYQSKTFHYSLMLLLIVLVVWELSEDIQFPPIETNLPEAAKLASLWVTKDVVRVRESNVFWVLMEASIHATIKQKLQLSPTVFEQLSRYAEFKADFHHVYIRRGRIWIRSGSTYPTWLQMTLLWRSSSIGQQTDVQCLISPPSYTSDLQ